MERVITYSQSGSIYMVLLLVMIRQYEDKSSYLMFSEWIVEALDYLNISAVITHTAFYYSSEIKERKKDQWNSTRKDNNFIIIHHS